ncbi:MAG: shikimate kinase [Armatimonadota bacterium]
MVTLRDGKRNIVLIGFMGCGKTTIGRQLAGRLDFGFTDTDALIEARIGGSIPEIFASQGESAFREIEHEVVSKVTSLANQVIATGGGAVLRDDNRALLSSDNAVVWLTARPDVVVARTERRRGARPLLTTDEDPLERVLRILSIRGPLYHSIADVIIDTSDRPVHRAVGDIVRKCVLPFRSGESTK